MSRAVLPLPDQQAKLERILDDRMKLYALSAKKGHTSAATALAKQTEVVDIRRTFAWFVANADWIKAEAQRRNSLARQEADLAVIETLPEVQEIRRHWPDAEVKLTEPA